MFKSFLATQACTIPGHNVPSEARPKIEGAEKFRRPMRAAGPQMKKEFITKVVGLENHIFDIGNMKYVSKY